MPINHSIFGKRMQKEAEIELLRATIDDCVSFLTFWKVYEPNRSEHAGDAFIAITELERECRERWVWLIENDEDLTIPF